MIERTFACSEGCSSMELGPDLGPSTKPCDCWNAEIARLNGALSGASNELRLMTRFTEDLRARVRGLEDKCVAYAKREEALLSLAATKTARVIALEAALLDPIRIREIAAYIQGEGHEIYREEWEDLLALADRIEKVRKG